MSISKEPEPLRDEGPSRVIPRILVSLHEAVLRDRGAPGFKGTLAVGVETAELTQWWVGKFPETTESFFCLNWPGRTDFQVLVDGRDLRGAEGLSENTRPLRVDGDVRLWYFFLQRYGPRANLLSLRVGEAKCRK